MKIYKIKVNGKTYKVELESIEENASAPSTNTEKAQPAKEEAKKAPSTNSDFRQVPSPIQGSVIDIKVKPGDIVKKGDVLLIIEAMKLENAVPSPYNGEVAEVLVNKGQNVLAKEIVVTIK